MRALSLSRRSSSSAPPPAKPEPVLRFRNHQPVSESLQEVVVQVEKPIVPSVEEQVEPAEIVHNDATQEPLLNLAPKRPNWDLKPARPTRRPRRSIWPRRSSDSRRWRRTKRTTDTCARAS